MNKKNVIIISMLAMFGAHAQGVALAAFKLAPNANAQKVALSQQGSLSANTNSGKQFPREGKVFVWFGDSGELVDASAINANDVTYNDVRMRWYASEGLCQKRKEEKEREEAERLAKYKKEEQEREELENKKKLAAQQAESDRREQRAKALKECVEKERGEFLCVLKECNEELSRMKIDPAFLMGEGREGRECLKRVAKERNSASVQRYLEGSKYIDMQLIETNGLVTIVFEDKFNKESIDVYNGDWGEVKNGIKSYIKYGTKELKRAHEYELERRACYAKEEEIKKNFGSMKEEDKYVKSSLPFSHEIIYKDLRSGTSRDVVIMWLTSKGISFDDLGDGKDPNASLRVRGVVTFEFVERGLSGAYVKFNEEIKKDDIVKKYKRIFGDKMKVEYSVNEPKFEDISASGSIAVYNAQCKLAITTDKVKVTASSIRFAGLVGIGEAKQRKMPFYSDSQKRALFELSKNGKADIVVDANGKVLKVTKDGEAFKEYLAIEKLKQNDDIIGAINVVDRCVAEAVAKREAEEAQRQESERKKQFEDRKNTALDF